MNLSDETEEATNLLKGKTVSSVKRFREKEVLIEFSDESRLFIDWKENGLELSITENFEGENKT
ncbi:MAG: hypothetical protein M3R11_04135 [Acidobacteriota bacterium]|nr:hypothetical protein [Acidobacteriota bacterium]